ncbi:hypothetical protein ACFLRF_03330 [Candidatus Altiarchaeota archaeon]
MQAQPPVRRDSTQDMPDPLLVQRPWQGNRLKDLSQKELGHWFSHMKSGDTLGMQDYSIMVTLGREEYGAQVLTNHLKLPDGSAREFKRDSPDIPLLEREKPIADQMGDYIASKLRDNDVYMAGFGMTWAEYARQMSSNLLKALKETGLEKEGHFQRIEGEWAHLPDDQLSLVHADYNHPRKTPDGQLHPSFTLAVTSRVKADMLSKHPEAIFYHTHKIEDSDRPSVKDVNAMIYRDGRSILIARELKDQVEPTYQVTEWKLNTGVELRQRMDEAFKVGELQPDNVLNDRAIDSIQSRKINDNIKKLVDASFSMKQYLLVKHGDGRLSFTEKQAA